MRLPVGRCSKPSAVEPWSPGAPAEEMKVGQRPEAEAMFRRIERSK